MSLSRMEQLKEWITADPEDLFLYYALALEYAKEGDKQQALSLLLSIIRSNPDYLPAYYQAGQCFESVANQAEASRHYEMGMAVAEKQKDRKTFNELAAAKSLLDDH